MTPRDVAPVLAAVVLAAAAFALVRKGARAVLASKPREFEVEVLVAALGLSEPKLRQALAVLADRQTAVWSRTLVVADSDACELLDPHGIRFEFVPPRIDWERHFRSETYEQFVEARMTEILDLYGPERTHALSERNEAVLARLARTG